MTMTYVLISVICLVFLPRLDLALYPSVDYPVISVSVSCNDAGPEEIELQVTEPMEDALDSLSNLEKMTSRSREGRSSVTLEFKYGTDLDDAYNDVNAIASRMSRFLPDWAESPSIIRYDSMGSGSIMRLILTGDRTKDELQYIAENTVQPLIERIDGVAQVNVYGGAPIEYEVQVDPNRLEAYGLTLQTVSNAIAARNVQSTGGEITQRGKDFQIATDARYMSLQDISETIISYASDGNPILVQDIADVEETTASGGRLNYLNGNEVVTISISNDSESNETTVASSVMGELDSIRAELPAGLDLIIQRDNTELIRNTMQEVANSAVQGVILAALIIFIFLRNIKSTIIISLSMPICILITLMLMSITGMSVNAMSMSGLILGIGMTVDASIIILENTYSFREKKERSAIAAILGSENMFTAIVASTLTTICVFLPIIIYKYDIGMIGVMFQDLVITVCISLFASLFVAVTLVPALCGSILRLNTRVQKPLKSRLLRAIDSSMARAEEKVRSGYVRLLSFFLERKMLLIVLLVLLLMLSVQKFGDLGISLVPRSTTDDMITVELTLDPGTTQDVTKEYVFEMQKNILSVLPEGSYEEIMTSVGSSNTGDIEIELPPIDEQEYSVSELQDLIRPFLDDRPEADWIFSTSRGVSGQGIDVAVYSESPDASLAAVEEIMALLEAYIYPVENIRSDLSNGAPKYSIIIDYQKAEDLGVTVSTLTDTVNAALTGITATEISTFATDTTYDVIVLIDPDEIQTVDDLSALMIPTGKGTMVRLDTLASFELGSAPRTITREDKERVNHVYATLREGYAASDVQAMVDRLLERELVLPEGARIEQRGEMYTFNEYLPTLIMIVLLALFLVYAVMAAQFESLIDPFIIFATIPLLFIGVIGIHVAMGEDFSLFSLVGIIALIGVVVNNGIVLIDCINRLVDHKVPVKQACLQAAYGRLRPILMTTLTTILGMIPMAFFPGEGAEMMQPIAITFVGGITTGAFLTLLLSPVLYLIFNKRREKRFNNPDALINQLHEYDMRKLKHLDDML